MNNYKDKINALIILIIIIILAYLLILKFGYIEHRGPKVPTGNQDIFDITDTDDKTTTTKPVRPNTTRPVESTTKPSEQNTTKPVEPTTKPVEEVTTKPVATTKPVETTKPVQTTKPIVTKPVDDTDDNKQNNDDEEEPVLEEAEVEAIEQESSVKWDSSTKLRIFQNPAYEFNEVIAPGTSNTYEFLIRNRNDFDILYTIDFVEENPYKINMMYALRSSGKYLVGGVDNYLSVSKLKQSSIYLKANQSKTYLLDWIWAHSSNDTSIGKLDYADYKLTINIKAFKYEKNS